MGLTKGMTNNPKGKPKGTKSEKTKQWEVLGDAIKERHTERFNAILDSLDNEKFADKYLQTLEYFQPKLQRTTLVGDETQPIILNIEPASKSK